MDNLSVEEQLLKLAIDAVDAYGRLINRQAVGMDSVLAQYQFQYALLTVCVAQAKFLSRLAERIEALDRGKA